MRIALDIGTIKKCMEFDGQEGYDNISDICGRLVHLIPMYMLIPGYNGRLKSSPVLHWTL